MLGKELRKLDYRLAIAGLVVIVVCTVVAGLFGGFRLAGLIGLLLFIVLDGVSCAWTVLTYSMAEKVHDEFDAADQVRFENETKDNPTVR